MIKQTGTLLATAWFVISYAVAAPLTPNDRDFIQNEQQERLQQNQHQREALWQAISPEIKSAVSPVETGTCFDIHRIIILNASLISDSEKQALARPYTSKCLNLTEINALVHAISDWYMQRGYITSRAYLTEQDLSQGELSIAILEGKLDTIRLEGKHPRMLHMAFPGLEGKVLNLRDIEQGMEQINRVRVTPVQIEILPSTKVGFSVVNLTAKPEFPLNASVGFDNSGQKNTGVGQLNAALTGNNLLGLADRWFISGGRSSAFSEWRDAQNVQAGLYGSERLTIGGESSVRGFKEQYLSGDNGGYLRNELNYSLFTAPFLGEVSATAALDGGWLKSDAQNREFTGTIWGSSVGVGTRNNAFYTQYTLGIPVSYPDYLQPDHVSIYARIGLYF